MNAQTAALLQEISDHIADIQESITEMRVGRHRCQLKLAEFRFEYQTRYLQYGWLMRNLWLSWWPHFPDTEQYREYRKSYLDFVAFYREKESQFTELRDDLIKERDELINQALANVSVGGSDYQA